MVNVSKFPKVSLTKSDANVCLQRRRNYNVMMYNIISTLIPTVLKTDAITC